MKSEQQLKEIFGDTLKIHEPLAQYTTLKIGGPADYFLSANSKEDIIRSVLLAKSNEIPYFILGGGSNILIGDKGFRGLIIKNNARNISLKGMKVAVKGSEKRSEVFVEADSGVLLNQLVRFTVDEALGGLEMHLGLPGTVGGAVYMNSKWMHPEGYVGDTVYQATILTSEKKVITVPRSYFQFGYDYSVLQKTSDTVISVVFCLHKSDKQLLWQIANDSIVYRRQSQPQGVLTAGCTFRNLSQTEALSHSTPGLTQSAGFLIDKSGIKGLTIGHAQISLLHANFIVNLGKATASNVVELIEQAREKVHHKFGVVLSEEIVRIGEF